MVGKSEETVPVPKIIEILVVMKDFRTTQLHDPNLATAWKNLKLTNRVPQEPEVSLYTHFVQYTVP